MKRGSVTSAWALAILLSWLLPLMAVRAQIHNGVELVKATLLAGATAVVPGKPFRVGLLLDIAPHWHTYWQYGGDAGLPARIDWELPDGFGAGPIEWPLPKKYVEPGDILAYAYEDQVLLLTTITPPLTISASEVTLKGRANWLVCAEICIPGKADLSLTLPVRPSAEPANVAIFDKYEKLLPKVGPHPFDIRWSVTGSEIQAVVNVSGEDVERVNFYPLPTADQQIGNVSVERRAPSEFLLRIPAQGAIQGVLALEKREGREGWMVSSTAPAGAAASNLWQYLFYGFLGGLILNLMPCVLPVISLKIFGFIRQAGEERSRILQHGMAFVGGIFVWFVGLGAVVVAMKGFGNEVTWAFQFQNPYFNLVIATIILVFALNLFGVFEIVLPGRAAASMADLSAKEGLGGSFFQGLFATLLATPCTAPFLGSALGFAFGQSPAVIFAMFFAVASGMAAPYFVLSANPGWMKFLPKPGPWMERLKQFMGFPLFATLLWLLYVIGNQKGLGAAIWTAAFLLGVGLACWIYGAFCGPLSSGRTRAIALVACALVICGSVWILGGNRFVTAMRTGNGSSARPSDGIPWEPFSKSRLEALLAEGKPVFVDFTADWCITCKFNESTFINIPPVQELIRKKGIVPLKADWTNANPEITATLKSFGRVGVPFYLVYPAGKREPIILPELLSTQLVMDALNRAS